METNQGVLQDILGRYRGLARSIIQLRLAFADSREAFRAIQRLYATLQEYFQRIQEGEELASLSEEAGKKARGLIQPKLLMAKEKEAAEVKWLAEVLAIGWLKLLCALPQLSSEELGKALNADLLALAEE